jgi:hypothetical protein
MTRHLPVLALSTLTLTLALVLAAACGPPFQPPPVSPRLVALGQARWPDTTAASLARGRATFVASCGKGGFCHRLRDPRAYPAARWPRILEKMAKKARLDDSQREDVLRFLLSVRELSVAPPAPASQSAASTKP